MTKVKNLIRWKKIVVDKVPGKKGKKGKK